jgi:hypothetical protein
MQINKLDPLQLLVVSQLGSVVSSVSVFLIPMLSYQTSVLLNWNVGCLNNTTMRQVVRDLIADHSCSLICLQETKM